MPSGTASPAPQNLLAGKADDGFELTDRRLSQENFEKNRLFRR